MSVAVIGIGNILFKDEGVGVYAAKYLDENYTFSPEIEIVDGGTLGFKLMSYYQNFERVIILDTVSIEDAPGSVYAIPARELMDLGTYRNTAHEVEVVEMLEICSMLEKIADVSVVGIIPEDIETVDISMTPTMLDHFGTLIDTAIAQLRASGIAVEKKGEHKTLLSIIGEYGSPSMATLQPLH